MHQVPSQCAIYPCPFASLKWKLQNFLTVRIFRPSRCLRLVSRMAIAAWKKTQATNEGCPVCSRNLLPIENHLLSHEFIDSLGVFLQRISIFAPQHLFTSNLKLLKHYQRAFGICKGNCLIVLRVFSIRTLLFWFSLQSKIIFDLLSKLSRMERGYKF